MDQDNRTQLQNPITGLKVSMAKERVQPYKGLVNFSEESQNRKSFAQPAKKEYSTVTEKVTKPQVSDGTYQW